MQPAVIIQCSVGMFFKWETIIYNVGQCVKGRHLLIGCMHSPAAFSKRVLCRCDFGIIAYNLVDMFLTTNFL